MGKVTSGNLLHLFLCYPIFLDDVIDDLICLINTDTMFTLDNVNVEEL